MIYKLIYTEHLKDKEASIDKLFDYVDDLFRAGKFDEVDDFLLTIPVDKISLQMIIGILSITNLAKAKLKNRSNFFKEARKFVAKTESERRVKRLFEGLE